jgi:uncharacterized protein (DUF1800 family)
MKFLADKPLRIWLGRHAPVSAFVATLVCGAVLCVGVVGAQQEQQGQEMEEKPTATSAASNSTDAKPASIQLSKAFKGKLPITELTEDEAILHALNRLGYGPQAGEIEQVRAMGLEKWIERQLKPDSIDDSALDGRLARYPTLKKSTAQLMTEFPQPNQAAKKEGVSKDQVQEERKEKARAAVAAVDAKGPSGPNTAAEKELAKVVGPQRPVTELSMAKMDRAIYSQRQLEAQMEDFWFNHFNVYAGKNEDKWMLTAYVRDTIRPHTMGKFQDLLIATAKSPAMLIYLDNWLSADPDAARRAQVQGLMRRRWVYYPPPQNPNGKKRQARGLNENYGREVMELHTLGVDAGYTQQDVIEMAKCLTGWTIKEPRKDPEFFFNEKIHVEGPKTVLGKKFNSSGMKDGEDALKMLANNPHTAKFISTKLARHFVSDDPPASLVDRMAKSYESSGGEIHVVLKTMIYSPEFWSRAACRAKVKTPFELAASTARALSADEAVTLPLVQWVGRMGEPLFQAQPPTGYSDKAETWVNTGALLNRLNFALSLSGNKISGTDVDLAALFGEDASSDAHAALNTALQKFLDGQVAPQTQQILEARLSDPQIVQAKLDDPVKHVNEALVAGLVLGAPEFQRR